VEGINRSALPEGKVYLTQRMNFALIIPVLLLSIVVHEVAHAWQARREGDTTAEELGRITLNPFKHLDLWGSVLVPGMLVASNAGILFGWAKPVPVDPRRFREHPWSDVRVSMAGIVSNLGLTVAFAGLALAVRGMAPLLPDAIVMGAGLVAGYGIFINLLLAFFNLLPIPPLDGSHVVAHLLPPRMAASYRRFGQFGIVALMLVMFVRPELFTVLMSPVFWGFDAIMAFVGGAG